MKPDINIALMHAAQEIINRFSPLVKDEYEKSRLGSWGALILISAMRFNDAASALKKENIEIADWLTSNTKVGKEDLEKSINLSTSEDNIDRLDQQNQLLRGLLNEEIERLEDVDDKSVLLDGYSLMRSMHQRRKVSDLIGLLQQSED